MLEIELSILILELVIFPVKTVLLVAFMYVELLFNVFLLYSSFLSK